MKPAQGARCGGAFGVFFMPLPPRPNKQPKFGRNRGDRRARLGGVRLLVMLAASYVPIRSAFGSIGSIGCLLQEPNRGWPLSRLLLPVAHRDAAPSVGQSYMCASRRVVQATTNPCTPTQQKTHAHPNRTIRSLSFQVFGCLLCWLHVRPGR